MDAKGNVMEELNWSDPDTLESKSSFIYDAEGHLLEETTFLNEEDISDKKKYKHDKDGKIAEVDIEYGDGSVSTQVFEYKGNHNLLTTTDENGEFEGSEERIFDEKGKPV